jgi:type IV pilus assembly protein PilM
VKGGVGIEFRNGTVNVALVRGGKDAKVDTFVTRPVPAPAEGETPQAACARTLREIWQQHELAGYPVAACLDAKDCILRQIVVPFTQEEKIRRMIRFEAENYLHAWAVEDVVVDFLKVDEIGEKSGILLTAGRKDTIRDRLAVLQEGGVDPEVLDLDVVALFNAFSRSPQFLDDGTVIVIDLGADAVRLLLIVDGILKKVRSFRVQAAMAAVLPAERQLAEPAAAGGEVETAIPAGDPLGDLMARFNALDREFAQDGGTGLWGEVPIAVLDDEDLAQLESPDPGGDGEDAGAWEPLLDRVFAEAQRTFASAVLGRGVDLVCLTGPGSGNGVAQEFFSDRFGAPTQRLDVGGMTDGEPAGDAASAHEQGAVAVGLALRAAGDTALGLDFRREGFRYEKRFARLRIPLFVTGFLLFLALLLNCLHLKSEQIRHGKEYQNVLQHQKLLYETTFREDAPRGNIWQHVLRRRWPELQRFIGEGGAGMPEYLSIVKLFGDLGKAVEAAGVRNVVWMDVNLTTKIEKSRRGVTRRSGIPAGDIRLLWDPEQPTIVNKIEKAINENSEYVKVSEYKTSTDKASGRTLGYLKLEFKQEILDRYQMPEEEKRARSTNVTGVRRSLRRG